jgi:hypothetical protein
VGVEFICRIQSEPVQAVIVLVSSNCALACYSGAAAVSTDGRDVSGCMQ